MEKKNKKKMLTFNWYGTAITVDEFTVVNKADVNLVYDCLSLHQGAVAHVDGTRALDCQLTILNYTLIYLQMTRHNLKGTTSTCVICRVGIIYRNIDISQFCITGWWIKSVTVRSTTFQTFCRTLNFLNRTINKIFMSTFVWYSSWFAFPQLYR